MRPASGGWTSPLPHPASSHRWVWFFSRPELSRQTPPKSPECQPFLMIEYLVYEKDLSLNTNICILLDRTKEPGPARRILDLTTAGGTRGLWLSHADFFPWSGLWSQSRHDFVHFSGNLSHYKIKKTRKLSKQIINTYSGITGTQGPGRFKFSIIVFRLDIRFIRILLVMLHNSHKSHIYYVHLYVSNSK